MAQFYLPTKSRWSRTEAMYRFQMFIKPFYWLPTVFNRARNSGKEFFWVFFFPSDTLGQNNSLLVWFLMNHFDMAYHVAPLLITNWTFSFSFGLWKMHKSFFIIQVGPYRQSSRNSDSKLLLYSPVQFPCILLSWSSKTLEAQDGPSKPYSHGWSSITSYYPPKY